MRALKDNIIETVIVVPYERMTAKKRRADEEHLRRLRAETSASWHARLPDLRAETDDAFDIVSTANISLQQQSLFFGKLPLELRRLVYAYVMDKEELQLELCEDGDRRVPFQTRCGQAQELLRFPKSCKMAYIEAKEYIYTCNTFRIPNLTAYFCLHRLLSPRLFQTIRSVRLRWAYEETWKMIHFLEGDPPYNTSSWPLMWSEISKMEGLGYLRIDMVIWAPCVDAAYEHVLLTPLSIAGVQELREFEVYASWYQDEYLQAENSGKTWPFKITRGMGYHKNETWSS